MKRIRGSNVRVLVLQASLPIQLQRIGHIHKWIGISQLPRLIRHHLSNFIAAITDIDAPHATQAIKLFIAIGVFDHAALGFGDGH